MQHQSSRKPEKMNKKKSKYWTPQKIIYIQVRKFRNLYYHWLQWDYSLAANRHPIGCRWTSVQSDKYHQIGRYSRSDSLPHQLPSKYSINERVSNHKTTKSAVPQYSI
ncbi:hypothetical protein NPIL_431761 [Nephila pilipes]|uniref:Uncharacterized protein n=1 Tax=Nephila pilipes TaxID=299642 RepID=A0A8X6ULX3_NEPPI|nr:hypothetical protein NPIL_431761 [Nephila pilipes]